jgi:hypothetical protein
VFGDGTGAHGTAQSAFWSTWAFWRAGRSLGRHALCDVSTTMAVVDAEERDVGAVGVVDTVGVFVGGPKPLVRVLATAWRRGDRASTQRVSATERGASRGAAPEAAAQVSLESLVPLRASPAGAHAPTPRIRGSAAVTVAVFRIARRGARAVQAAGEPRAVA